MYGAFVLNCKRDHAALCVPDCSAVLEPASPLPCHGVVHTEAQVSSREVLYAAQSHLCNSSVLVIGAGGLGSPVAIYLAAAGVGRLGIADHDAVELNNLHRQIAHRESTVGVHKCDSAGLLCRSINSSIQVTSFCPAAWTFSLCC